MTLLGHHRPSIDSTEENLWQSGNTSNESLFRVELDFSEITFIGRQKQASLMQSSYDGLGNESRVVIVDGQSGTGKTTLVDALFKRDEGWFVSGTFLQLNTSKPYSSLVDALHWLCDLIHASPKKRQISGKVKKALGSEAEVLSAIIPTLYKLLGDDERAAAAPAKSERKYHKAWGFERLKILFRDFLRAVASPEAPLILHLDDLQWADDACLKLLEYLCNDSEIQGFFLILAYRDNEVGGEFLDHLSSVPESKLTKIHLDNLPADQVNQIISEVLSLKPHETKELTDVVYSKTLGNPFFVVQFLKSLEENKLLHYSIEKFAWGFDVQKISTETDLSNNVVELVANKLQRQPPATQEIFKVAACFGSHFSTEIIRELMEAVHEEKNDDNEMIMKEMKLERRLRKACKNQLLDKCVASGKYKFSHNKVQRAAYNLVPEGEERARIHLKIGNWLLEKLKHGENEEWMLFVAADQFSRSSDLIKDDFVKENLAKLHLDVAERAIQKSAFCPAAAYLESGIQQLSEKDWDENYNLMLRLHTLLGSMRYCIGDFAGCKSAISEVLSYGWSIEDKMPAYHIMIDCLASQGRLSEAMEVACDILSKLWEPMPMNPKKFFVAVELIKAKNLLRGKKDADLVNYREATDNTTESAMRVLVSLSSIAWLAVNTELLGLVCTRMIRMCMIKGYTKYAANALASFGFMLARFGKYGEAFRFGVVASQVIVRFNARECETRVLVTIHMFLSHLRKPYHDSLEPLLHGHRVGFEYGDIESAELSILGYSTNYIYCGLPLGPCEQDMRKFARQMTEYSQSSTLGIYQLYWQMVLNFQGKSEDPSKLTGEVMDEDKVMAAALESNNIVIVQGIWWIRMKLAYFFGDLDTAGRMADKLWTRRKSVDQTVNSGYQKIFYAGTTAFALARKYPSNPRYLKRGHKVVKRFQQFVKEGVVNCHHMLLILKAEKFSIANRKWGAEKRDEALGMYQAAINSCSRSGILHHNALANELCGLYAQRDGDKERSELHLARALELYDEWGAKAKVQQMEESYIFLGTTEGRSHASSSSGYGKSFRGRSRFTRASVDLHRGKSLKSSLNTSLASGKSKSSSSSSSSIHSGRVSSHHDKSKTSETNNSRSNTKSGSKTFGRISSRRTTFKIP